MTLKAVKAQAILRQAVLHMLTREHDLNKIDAGDREAYCLMLRTMDYLATH